MRRLLPDAGVMAAAVLICGTSVLPAKRLVEPLRLDDDRQDSVLRQGPVTPSRDSQQSKIAEQRVAGEVVDRDGNPVANAEVVFVGPKKQSVRTDQRGAFSFTGPPGTYKITVHAGARHKTFEVKVESNELKPKTLTIDREDSQ